MEFGVLLTAHPNTETEPYPHRRARASPITIVRA